MTERLRAYPQTEREASQVATIALLVLLIADETINEDSDNTASVFVSKEHIEQYAGQDVVLFLEEADDGMILTVELV